MAIHILIAVQQQVAADVGFDLFALGDRAAQIGIPAGLDGERLARVERGFLVAEGERWVLLATGGLSRKR